MKRLPLYIIIIAALGLGQNVAANELETHMVYKVTTYNFGALQDHESTTHAKVNDYDPLMITGSRSDILSGTSGHHESLATTPDPKATEGFAIAAEYKATPQLAVQGTFGITSNSLDRGTKDPDSSWEANLGLVYRLLDNLSYELHFGYMDTGDVFEERNTYSDVESIIMISNKLTMSF